MSLPVEDDNRRACTTNRQLPNANFFLSAVNVHLSTIFCQPSTIICQLIYCQLLHMIAWVMYDIEDDKRRNKVAKLCKQAGIYRVQFSVFLGTLDTNQKDTLQLQIEEVIDIEKDSVYIFPMSKNELQATVLLGKAFDKKLITDDVKALFL